MGCSIRAGAPSLAESGAEVGGAEGAEAPVPIGVC